MFSGRARPRMLMAAVVGVLALAALASCSTSGRDLDPPGIAAPAAQVAGGATSSTQFVPPIVTGLGGFELRSATFLGGDAMPLAYTLGGGNATPPLEWVNVPAGTVELAVVLRDIDNDEEVRWVVVGIPADTPGFTGGLLPGQATILGRSPFVAGGDEPPPAYRGPEAPLGVTHRFVFTLYAFSEPTGLGSGSTIAEGVEAINLFATTSASLLVTHTGA